MRQRLHGEGVHAANRVQQIVQLNRISRYLSAKVAPPRRGNGSPDVSKAVSAKRDCIALSPLKKLHRRSIVDPTIPA